MTSHSHRGPNPVQVRYQSRLLLMGPMRNFRAFVILKPLLRMLCCVNKISPPNDNKEPERIKHCH